MVALGGRWVVVLASCDGADDGEAGGVFGWWLERWRERGKEKLHKCGQSGWFFGRLWTRFSPLSGHEIVNITFLPLIKSCLLA